MLIPLITVIIGFAILVWSADVFVAGAASIAENAGLSPVLIGLTIVSLGTSAPEILVSVTAALTGSGGLAIGNAVGSNIANIGLVLGITLTNAARREAVAHEGDRAVHWTGLAECLRRQADEPEADGVGGAGCA